MRLKTDVVVVGSGAGGATVAKELASKNVKVLVLERGLAPKEIGSLKTAVLKLYDRCALRASMEGIIVYRGLMLGGTTVVSCGNGVRVLENELKSEGIELEREFEETERELNVKPMVDRLIGPGSRLIMDAANRLGVDMVPMPKYMYPEKCNSCGKCVLGCKREAKWSALEFIKEAKDDGAEVVTDIDVKSVVIKDGKVIGVVAIKDNKVVRVYANKVVVAAGGIGSPVILKKSGLSEAGNRLFVDMFNVTYGILNDKKINLWKEPTMAVVSTKYYKEKGFILAPFLDVPLVLRWVMSKRKQLKGFKYENLLGIMVKIRDESVGGVTESEKFEKRASKKDRKILGEGETIAAEILIEAGVKKEDIIFTKPRGAHPGGGAAIGEIVDNNLETKIKNLYVCDASVLPVSPGEPPIVTIVALAKRLCKHLTENSSD